MKVARFLRDAFFITSGVAVLGDQVFFVPSAQPVLVFLGIFLLGCAPALHVDERPGGNPWIKLLLSMLGDGEGRKK
jgi:hypothetical protein